MSGVNNNYTISRRAIGQLGFPEQRLFDTSRALLTRQSWLENLEMGFSGQIRSHMLPMTPKFWRGALLKT